MHARKRYMPAGMRYQGHYEYLICKGKNPFYIDLALFSHEKFDTDLMNKAAQ
jgi:hypothetical protein